MRTWTSVVGLVAMLAAVLGPVPATFAADGAVVIPAPAMDSPRAAGPPQTAVLAGGRFVSAVAGCAQCGLGLCGRRQGDGAVRAGERWLHRARRVRRDQLRPEGDLLWRDPADLLLRGARSDSAHPPGARRGHAVSLRHLLRGRGAAEHRAGLHRAAR